MPPSLPEHVRAFLEQPHFAVMVTVNRSGTPQATVMWYALHPQEDVIVLNGLLGAAKTRNLRRDPRMALCVEAGPTYVTLEGRAELIEDLAQQERDVNDLIAPRYIGQRLGSRRWERIKNSGRVGIHLRIERFHARGL